MHFSTDFRGRIVQLTDAIDRFDAVSNQVVALDRLFGAMGFETAISAQHAHPDREALIVARSELSLSEQDVLIVHHYGFSEGLEEWLAGQYCTKILVYHNITPDHFFDRNKVAADFCRRGRDQLRAILPMFHFCWGDSSYNVAELIELGADKDSSAVIPIVVEPAEAVAAKEGWNGRWLFVGRIAPNKGAADLVRSFARIRKANPDAARELVLVGGRDPQEGYVAEVEKAIAEAGIADCVRITGKIDDKERDSLLRGSDVYVSLSEHEGFGVPLAEAPLAGVPVLALDRAAVAETLGGIGVYKSVKALERALLQLSQDSRKRADLVASQRANAARFSNAAVAECLHRALAPVIPAKRQYRTVSIVICTYNRRDYLERCLDYLEHQSNGEFEVVVVDGPSDDGTAELLQANRHRVKIVRNPERNLSKSRNLGIDAAAGDIVAFIDDDAIPFDDWIATILEDYNRRPLTTAGLGGPAYYAGSLWFQAQDNGISKDCKVKVNIASDEIGRDGWFRYNTGTNATFTRDALAAVDGFDEQYDYYLDEAELCLRLQDRNRLIGFAPEILVRHEFAKSHNRQGGFDYNWFTICKNSAYFIATNGELKGKALESFVAERIRMERELPLDQAVDRGELSAEQRDRHVEAIRKGVRQGLKDSASWPKTRRIADRPDDFLPYRVRHDRIAVGRDLKPLHICIVSKEFPPFTGSGGVGTLYYHLASELLLMGHRISIVTPGEEKVHRQGRFAVHFTAQRDFSLPVEDNGFAGNMDWSLTALAKLAAIHRDDPVDIVDSALWDSESLAFSLLDDRPPLVVRLVTPYSVTAKINDWKPSPEAQAWFDTAERTLIERADAVIPISRTIATTIGDVLGLERDGRWHVGHCGIAPWPFFDVNGGYDDFPELGGLEAIDHRSTRLVAFIGRLEKRKGIDVILGAAQRILQADKDVVLVIGGRDQEGWAEKFRENLAKGLHSRLLFLGEVDDGTREKLFAHSYCALFPSRYESFGLVPLEAFVHGCPVIASSAGAIPEVVEEGASGILVPPGDSDALARAVIDLLANPDLRARLSAGAKRRVRQLSARNSAVHSVQVYSGLLSRSR